MKKHYKSVFTNEQVLLKAVIEIHLDNNDIQLDPMYFKGNFYKDGVNPPAIRYDINPQVEGVEKADAGCLLHIPDNSIQNVILDPPFLFGIHGKTKDYYSSKTHTIFKDYDELVRCYISIIKEASRYLVKKGILIFKCQDYTDSKTTMTHCLVKDLAEQCGFYAKDLAILVKPNKVTNPNTKQRHFRKIHTYFWIFEKKPIRQRVKSVK